MHLQQIIAKWRWDGTLHLIIFTMNKLLNTKFGPFFSTGSGHVGKLARVLMKLQKAGIFVKLCSCKSTRPLASMVLNRRYSQEQILMCTNLLA